jgi:hypothetical protein
MELQTILGSASTESVTDEMVVESYQQQVQSDGLDPFFLEYLRLGQLAHVHGSTLFVHGAVTETNMGTVPGKKQKKQRDAFAPRRL